MTDDLVTWTATRTAAAVRGGEVSATEVVAAALDRAEAAQAAFNAFTVIRREAAMAEATDLNAGGSGHDGPLAGVPIVVKEEFDIRGYPTTLGGRGNSTPVLADSEIIRRLRAAGAIIVGITTMPEFGQFTITESMAHGITRNPWDPTRSPGGSSGGSAAAVAAGVSPIGLGADGGGSIRIPASCCSLVGLKLTRGRSTFAPLAQHWFGLVVPGGVSRTVDDTALLLDVIAGNTPVDRWRWAPPTQPYAVSARRDPGPLRIAWTTRPVTPGLTTDPQIAAATEDVARTLQSLGHRPRRVGTRWPTPTDAFLPQVYGGIRVEGSLVEHPELLEPRTRQTIALSGWATDRVVQRALRRSERVAAAVDERFLQDADILMLPTMPVTVPPVGLLDGMNLVRAQLATLPYVSNMAIFNVSGHPAISIPAGLSSEGWPIGVQLVARRGREDLLLALARQIETASSWPTLPA